MKLYPRIERQSRLQKICFGLIIGIAVHATAQTWTNTPSFPTFMVSSSADGSKLIAACGDSDVCTSTNSGSDWVQHSGLANSTIVASSADGSVLFTQAGELYASTNSGTTWGRVNVPSYNGLQYPVQFIVCSADGRKVLVALGGGVSGPLYTSPDSGTTWIANNAPVTNWQCAASSADGSKLVAAFYGRGNGGGIYTSTNFGTTWISNSVPRLSWTAVASSADGSDLVAAAEGAGIYTSTNSGVTWTTNAVPNQPWISISSSADGSKLLAAAGGYYSSGPIYSSTNYGANWISNNAPVGHWTSVASSADGYMRFASHYDGSPSGVFRSAAPVPSPLINISNAGGDLLVSWLVPSARFSLQQSMDLLSWADVTNTQTLDFTNLHYQTTLFPANGSGFYRLAAP